MVNSPEVKSFTFYSSYYDACKFMPADVRSEYLEAIFEYAFYGKEPDCEHVNPTAMAAFTLARPNIDNSLKNARNGAKGGSAKKADGRSNVARKPACKPASEDTASDKEREKEKEKDKEKDKEKEGDKEAGGGKVARGAAPRQGPPTLECVTAFVEEEGLTFDVEDFFNYYAARGWKLGGAPVADWKALALRWQSKEKEFGRAQKVEVNVDEEILSVFD
jgi:hypothetical protein